MTWKNKEKEMLRTLNEKIFLQDPLKHLDEDEYDAGDGMNEEYVIECKFRNMPSTLYGDCFLEKLKYDRLMEKSKINNRKAAYVAAYTDGSFYGWNLTRLTNQGFDFGWTNNLMKATTHFENNEQVEKLSCKMRFEDGKKLI